MIDNVNQCIGLLPAPVYPDARSITASRRAQPNVDFESPTSASPRSGGMRCRAVAVAVGVCSVAARTLGVTERTHN